MSRYKFCIDAYFAKKDYLEIDEVEKDLFKIDDKTVKLKSLDGCKISKSKGIKIECGMFENLDNCIKTSKKVYSNFLIRLNNTDISYYIDKESYGNFIEYCSDDDAYLYKEIRIIDTYNTNNDLHIGNINFHTRMYTLFFQ